MEPDNKVEDVEQFLSSLFSLYRIHHLYPSTHPAYKSSLEPVTRSIEGIFSDPRDLAFIIVEHEFIYEGEPLLRSMSIIRDFAKLFEQFRIERFTLYPGVTTEEIVSLIKLLSRKPEETTEEDEIRDLHHIYGLTHIRLERLAISPDETESAGVDIIYGNLPATIRRQYGTLYDNTKTIFSALSKGEAGDLGILKRHVNQTVDDLFENIDDFVFSFHINNTAFGELDHEINVCLLTIAFAKWLELERPEMKELALAALVHDIGKAVMPEEIKTKPAGLLGGGELEIYRQHPLQGAELLLSMNVVPQLAVIVCYEHHAGFDKRGFPRMPADHSSHFGSFLVNVLEKYERQVRLSPRPGLPEEFIAGMKPFRGAEFEPHIFDLFASFVKGYA